MTDKPPVNFDKVDEMTEGDAEFKAELISAIYISLQELRDKYIEGASNSNNVIIQEIRHKIKPSISLFDMLVLSELMIEGKEIIEVHGFEGPFLDHLDRFIDAVEDAIAYVKPHVTV